jgi:SAM-dependent methyltransferase
MAEGLVGGIIGDEDARLDETWSSSFVCECCGAQMQSLGGWVYACHKCRFQASSLTPAAGTGIPGLEELRLKNFELILDRLESVKILQGARLLEVGSARGWFLEAAVRRGVQVQGIEPETANAEISRTNGLDVEIGFFPNDLKNCGPFDLIIFNDSFEHLAKPSAVIQAVQSLLKPGGILVINLPSSKGVLFLVAGLLSRLGVGGPLARLWQMGMPSPHVSYFNPENLSLLAQRHSNLQLIKRFSMTSVSRQGLASRIGASHSGAKGVLMFAVIWGLSFILPLLPSDIEVLFFCNPAARSGRSVPRSNRGPVSSDMSGSELIPTMSR